MNKIDENEVKLQEEALSVKPEDRAVILGEGSPAPLPLERGRNVYSDEEIANWKIELMRLYPQIPEHMIDTTLDAFQTHPKIFDRMKREYEENPNVYKHHNPTFKDMFPEDVDCTIPDPRAGSKPLAIHPRSATPIKG
jgi:hypothetical protein